MKVHIPLSIIMLAALAACSAPKLETQGNAASANTASVAREGSAEWLAWVEKETLTADQHAHGPDIGSSEWCGVIEFRLFNRQSAEAPCSDAWNRNVTRTLLERRKSGS